MQATEMQQVKRRDAATIGDALREAEEQQQYLTFLLGDEMFAIGILSIREIIEYGFVTEVPMTPPFIRDDIEPPPEFGACIRSDFIQGMGKVVTLLDVNRVLLVDEVAVIASMKHMEVAAPA